MKVLCLEGSCPQPAGRARQHEATLTAGAAASSEGLLVPVGWKNNGHFHHAEGSQWQPADIYESGSLRVKQHAA